MRRRTLHPLEPYPGYNFVGKFSDDSTTADWYYWKDKTSATNGTKVSIAADVDPKTKVFKTNIKLDTSSSYMFSDSKIERIDKFPDTSSVTSMDNMFYCCAKLTTLNLSGWDTSAVTTMDGLFRGCTSLTTLDLSGWNTTALTNIRWLCNGCTSLTTLDLSGWNTSNILYMPSAFVDCKKLTSINLSGWDTPNAININQVFLRCPNLQNITGSTKIKDWINDNKSTMSLSTNPTFTIVD